MRWNPLFNAFGAAAYIGIVATVIHFISSIRHDTPDTLLDSMTFLSLVVFSAAVMAFLFFYRPVVLMVEHKEKEALMYFIKTLAAFGTIALIAIVCVFAQ